MPQALIKINGIPGSNTDLPIDTLVQLDNQNIGGEITYKWEILDQPPGPADILSSTSIQNPTFTPKKEGSYLIRLTVNESLVNEQVDAVIAAILQLKTRKRVPAAGETVEADPIDGWATDVNIYLRAIDGQLADPGVIVGVNASGGTMNRGTILRVTSGQIIKAGLPGQETVPGFVAAPATSLGSVDELLCVLEGGVDGTPNPNAGALIRTRFLGRLAAIPLGSGGIGDTVFVSDTAQIALSPGTVRRQIGSIMSINGSDRDIWFDGVGGAAITPLDAPYVVYGNPGILANAQRVDGLNSTGASGLIPYTFKSSDVGTVATVFKRFSAASADISQWQSEAAGILAHIDALGNAIFNAGGMAVGSNTTPGQTGSLLVSRGISVGFTADPAQYQVLVRDAGFGLDFTGANPQLIFDMAAGPVYDSLLYDRASNQFKFYISGTLEMYLSSTGLTVVDDLWVGGGTLYLGTDDYVNWDGTNWQWILNSAEELRLTGSGLAVTNGLYVGAATGVPVDKKVYAEGIVEAGENVVAGLDVVAGRHLYSNLGRMYLGADDYVNWDGTNWQWILNAVEEMRLTGSGLAVNNGLYVGAATGTPEDNNIIAEGAVKVWGGTLYLGADDYVTWNGTDWRWVLNSAEQMRLVATGLRVLNGLVVGTVSSDPITLLQVTGSDPVAGSYVRYARIQSLDVVKCADTSNWMPGFTNESYRLHGSEDTPVSDGVDTTHIWMAKRNSLGFSPAFVFGWRRRDGIYLQPGDPDWFSSTLPRLSQTYNPEVNPLRGTQLGYYNQRWQTVYAYRGSFGRNDTGQVAEIAPFSAGRLLWSSAGGNAFMAFCTTGQTPNYRCELSHVYPLFGGLNSEIGSASEYWLQLYVTDLRYKTIATFDAYDDLGLIEQCESDSTRTSVIKAKGGADRAVQPVRASTIPWPMLADKDPHVGDYFIDGGDSIMFLLGAIKQLYKKHKTEVEALQARLAILEART